MQKRFSETVTPLQVQVVLDPLLFLFRFVRSMCFQLVYIHDKLILSQDSHIADTAACQTMCKSWAAGAVDFLECQRDRWTPARHVTETHICIRMVLSE